MLGSYKTFFHVLGVLYNIVVNINKNVKFYINYNSLKIHLRLVKQFYLQTSTLFGTITMRKRSGINLFQDFHIFNVNVYEMKSPAYCFIGTL